MQTEGLPLSAGHSDSSKFPFVPNQNEKNQFFKVSQKCQNDHIETRLSSKVDVLCFYIILYQNKVKMQYFDLLKQFNKVSSKMVTKINMFL